MGLSEKAETGDIHLLCFDPTHQIHNTVIGKCWQQIGRENTITLPSNTGRRRLSVLGAINIISDKFTSLVTEDNCDREMIKVALSEIRKDYPDNKKIVLILDNATYNRAYNTQDFAASLNIQLKFLPPYCPNLNLIERIWKLMKKKSTSKYLLFYFLNYENEIKNLLSQKFQIIKAS